MRDIRVQVLLLPEEYLALDTLAGDDGDSHSGLLRRLLLREVRHRAVSMAADHQAEAVRPAHKVHNPA